MRKEGGSLHACTGITEEEEVEKEELRLRVEHEIRRKSVVMAFGNVYLDALGPPWRIVANPARFRSWRAHQSSWRGKRKKGKKALPILY